MPACMSATLIILWTISSRSEEKHLTQHAPVELLGFGFGQVVMVDVIVAQGFVRRLDGVSVDDLFVVDIQGASLSHVDWVTDESAVLGHGWSVC